MSDTKKYVFACIRIPIEIKADGHHITYNDHAKVDFEKCDELPPKSNLGKYDLAEIFENMSKPPLQLEPPISTSQPPPPSQEPTTLPPMAPPKQEPTQPQQEPVVLQSEIKTSKPPMKNSSFKNRQSTSSKYSQKNRSYLST